MLIAMTGSNYGATMPLAASDHHEHQQASVPPPPRLPDGPYRAACHNCTLRGDSLQCVCAPGKAGADRTSISLSSCSGGYDPDGNFLPVVNVTQAGYLTCVWKPAPPPRVGALTGTAELTPVERTCRYFTHRTFIAPQMPPSGGVLTTHKVARYAPHSAGPCTLPPCPKPKPAGGVTPLAVEQCCAACLLHTKCRAWTVVGDVCSLVSTSNTAYPSVADDVVSGYPLSSDPASFCANKWGSRGEGQGWADTTMAAGVSCSRLKAVRHHGNGSSSASAFPPAWAPDRGDAWFFFPSNHTADGESGAGSSPPLSLQL
eukprot:SAG25_NODE_898_length_4869_cov_112.186373_4_plen_315_part_00